MHLLVVTITGLPLLAGALVVIASWHARPSTVHRATLAITGLTASCALALLSHAGNGPAVTLAWLPGTGRMGLATGVSTLYVVLATTWAAFITLGTASPNTGPRPLGGATTLLALGAANVAFLADHFLARYVALEVVALCVSLAPLAEMKSPAATHRAWRTYLLLRAGDAGMLAAVLLLNDASGTLHIDPALEAGTALGGAQLEWIAAGFALAAWVKLGGWPFHLWSRAGREFPLASQAWLYATLVPNLGAYLLYRVTPLLAVAGLLRTSLLWLGAGGAALAALIAPTRADPRTAMVHVGAAQGGLALLAAATGVKSTVWLGVLVLTPVRLVLFLAADAAQRAGSTGQRGLLAGLFGLGGLALTGFGLLTTWWVRKLAPGSAGGEGALVDAPFVAQIAVVLTGIWAARAAWRLAFAPGAGGLESSLGSRPSWREWVVLGLLGAGVLTGALAFRRLAHALTTTSHLELPPLPTLPALLQPASTVRALLLAIILSLIAQQLQRHVRWRAFAAPEPAEAPHALGEGLVRAAQTLRAAVETGILERMVSLVARVVTNGARAVWAIEGGLERFTHGIARTVADGSVVTYRMVEQQGLENLLRGVIQAALNLSRAMQRWHTGQLRRNLLWVLVALAVAMLALVAWGW
jgi:NADH:ubiquinone oxidoreductase subunit 5 (subunit L)/multisubunit Na+/H+ antiporter MnhA subunit